MFILTPHTLSLTYDVNAKEEQGTKLSGANRAVAGRSDTMRGWVRRNTWNAAVMLKLLITYPSTS